MFDQPRIRRELIVKEVTGELLVYDELSTKAFCLNETAAGVWAMCDGKTTLAEMALRAQSTLGVAIDEDLVALAISRFREDGLLEPGSVEPIAIADVSRADLLARVGRAGLAATIALPVVVSIVAPTAAKAYGTRHEDDDREGDYENVRAHERETGRVRTLGQRREDGNIDR